ncbi:hypothetical protein [Soonwooa sp.]|uniref:hypothetical protein n=1 Tax=Soonwooa sp. TaxID=1938592 RepID=UPI00262A84B7|nr:hypothetical protein [Soonwooa sp.]
MKKPTINFYQLESATGKSYIIISSKDKTLPNFDIYQLVDNEKKIAEEFGISEFKEGRKSALNTREMIMEVLKKYAE